MTKEDVEKAAGEYSGSILGFRNNYAIVEHRAFSAGAYWRINSVWHNANEVPTIETENILVIGINEEIIPIRICESVQKSWHEKVEYLHIMRWAYIKDLLPILINNNIKER